MIVEYWLWLDDFETSSSPLFLHSGSCWESWHGLIDWGDLFGEVRIEILLNWKQWIDKQNINPKIKEGDK